MNRDLSNIRVSILESEYRTQIAKYSKKYPHLRKFPELSVEEFTQAFFSKTIEVRSHLRILAIAILSEYVSVKLDAPLVTKLYMIADSIEPELNVYKKEDPLVFLLIILFLHGEEIYSGNVNNQLYFESFLIIEKEFREHRKFHNLVYQINESKGNFGTFIDNLATEKKSYWNAYYSGIESVNLQISNRELLVNLLELIDFLNSIANLLKHIESKLLASSFWHFYSPFFNALIHIYGEVVMFLRAVEGLQTNIWFHYNFPDDDIKLIAEEQSRFVKASLNNLNWLLDHRIHKSLDKYVGKIDGLAAVFATFSNDDFAGESIDIEELRMYLKGVY